MTTATTPTGLIVVPVSTRFWTGVALAVTGFILALTPVIASASAVGAPAAGTSQSVPAASVGSVVATVIVHGRRWSGNPGG